MTKILIVDDDPIARRLLNIILTKADKGYSVIEADSGKKALALADKDVPDIMLLDVMMPEMDGFEVCERLKADEKCGSIPILFITAMERIEDMVRGFQLGAVDYISKPINAEEVRARVTAHLRIKKAEEERVEAENLRTLQDIVVTLNHNMNQPLMAAYTYVIAALEGIERSDKNRKVYQKVKEELDKLNSILRRIQSLEKVERTEYVNGTEMIDLGAPQRENKEFQVQLKQVAKMAALGEFAAAVAHAMNQPLTAISAHIESLLMADAISLNRELKSKIEKIKDQFTRLGLTIRRVTEYSKARFAAKTSEDVNTAVKDPLDLFEQQLKDHNIELTLRLEEGLPKIYIDRHQVRDVIINLLLNARDAIDEIYHQEVGGRIKIFSGVTKDKGAVIMGVIDNGKPITEGTEEKLFKSFFTTKEPNKGTGLGLAVCYDAVKKHNGVINFAVLKGGAKVFWFALPLDSGEDLARKEGRIQKEIIDTFNASGPKGE